MAKRSERRMAWLTDIHLEFLIPSQIDAFIDEIRTHAPDLLVITGDIAQAPMLRSALVYLAHRLLKPVYFVLGNHDFYKGNIKTVRKAMTALTRERKGPAWLPAAGIIQLAPDTAMVGHDGWSDGRYGDFMASPIVLNDYVHIEDLKSLDNAQRLRRLQALGDQAADYLRGLLPEAARAYDRVFVLTHPPPFQESCWFKGKTPPDDDPYLPHFTCKAVGDVLLDMANDFPQTEFTVLCGHVHGQGETQMRDNLRVLTGGAEYRAPEVQRVFTFQLDA